MPSANTTPWQLEGTISALRALGLTDLVCVENETVVTDPKKGDQLNLLAPVLDAYQIPVKFNFKPADMAWVKFKPKARMHALDRIYPDGIEIPDYFPGKNIVHLPTVKCHIYTTTTGAMKNAFGGLLYKHRHYTHTWIHEVLVDLLAIQKEIHPGIFAVMDGTTAGNGPGPRILIPVEKNVILASADQVAIDAVAAKMMGFDPMQIPYIRMAHEDGLGVGDPREIEVVGDSIEFSGLALPRRAVDAPLPGLALLVRTEQGPAGRAVQDLAGEDPHAGLGGGARLAALAVGGAAPFRALEARDAVGTAL